MTFDWSQYLNLAQKLTGTPDNLGDEAALRSAISRAYYAAFIKGRNFLRDKESVIIPNERTHQYVINTFKNHPDSVRQKIGQRLARLRSYRNQADYEDTISNLVDKTQESLTLSRRIISTLSSL